MTLENDSLNDNYWFLKKLITFWNVTDKHHKTVILWRGSLQYSLRNLTSMENSECGILNEFKHFYAKIFWGSLFTQRILSASVNMFPSAKAPNSVWIHCDILACILVWCICMYLLSFFSLSLSFFFFDKRHMNGSIQNPINLNLLKSVYGVKEKKKTQKPPNSLIIQMKRFEYLLCIAEAFPFFNF